MTNAFGQVIAIAELLEQILVALPLDAMLRSRRVCRTWKSTIDQSTILRSIRSDPYIGVHLEYPYQIDLNNSSHLTAVLTLYADGPVTVRLSPSCLIRAWGFTRIIEEGVQDDRPASQQLREPPRFWHTMMMISFQKSTAKNWLTLLPGIPHALSWPYRPDEASDPDKVYILRVSPDNALARHLGTTRTLLDTIDAGRALWDNVHPKTIPLRGENKVRFSVLG